jgi:hypothetical protein
MPCLGRCPKLIAACYNSAARPPRAPSLGMLLSMLSPFTPAVPQMPCAREEGKGAGHAGRLGRE